MEKSNCQLLVALPGITMEVGLHLLMGLLSGISTLIIFSLLSSIYKSLHLLAFRQPAFIPLLTFPYWPQQFLSILSWLLLLLFILSAGSLSLFDLSILMAFCSLHFCFSVWHSHTSKPDPAISHLLFPQTFCNRLCERSKSLQGNGISVVILCV